MRWSQWLAVTLLLVGSIETAQAGGLIYHGCPPWRPCGWGNTWGGNRLIPQGFRGVDFRPACQAHDDCYANGCNRRKDCDREFRNNMFSACECSDHPALCRMRARYFYTTARLFGGFVR